MPGCAKPHEALGWCGHHYSNWRISGDPLISQRPHLVGAKRTYSDQEMALLADLSIPASEVAEAIGITSKTVRKIRREIHAGTLEMSDWIQLELDFISRNLGHMSIKAMAAFLQRPYDQVKAKSRKLRADGAKFTADLNPWTVAARSLVARSCRRCGKLRGAEWFSRHPRDNTWFQNCRKCVSERSRNTAEKAERKQDLTRSYAAKAQAYTLERAENHRKEWTAADLSVLSDPSMTTLQKAVALKRTYHSVHVAASRNGLVSRRPDWERMERQVWHIFWEFEDDLEEAS